MLGFPRGKCQVASRVAASVLERAGWGTWDLVFGAHPITGQFGGHFWLERGNCYYDPTVHQFDEYTTPIVGETPHPLSASRFVRSETLPHGVDEDYRSLAPLRDRILELIDFSSQGGRSNQA